ncbi:uncharacterized protein LOC124540379 [Vanessa cardui]|uniref:uncharacterized protein LOC124533089 n=1 Tax=Vanessa cardui TaxID=171605 RepID=UPI001F146E8B|nr:uncharacterized protein LOC124533089 [Vanessa cardui]XP_046971625.1 uncharacterized protein LOC124538545 [Vanessa cardui]XP_046973836.1 uncharacterized protein LOC124540379 [Vanessa cardui]
MENITKILQSIQKDLQQQKTDMKNMQETITTSINENINLQFQKLDKRFENLEKKVEEQEKYIDIIDNKLRKKNLIFFGLEEKEKSYQELEDAILDVTNNLLTTSCKRWEIESVTRIGKKGHNPRPVIVTFSTLGKKIQVLKSKKYLKELNCGYYIKEDFPPKLVQKRKELQEIVNIERKKGINAVLRFDRIIYPKQKENKDRSNSNNKRNQSQSPEYIAVGSKNEDEILNKTPKHPPKKNKHDIRSFVNRNNNNNKE